MFYMHVHGHGSAADLARKIKPAIDLIGRWGPRAGTAAWAAGARVWAKAGAAAKAMASVIQVLSDFTGAS